MKKIFFYGSWVQGHRTNNNNILDPKKSTCLSLTKHSLFQKQTIDSIENILCNVTTVLFQTIVVSRA